MGSIYQIAGLMVRMNTTDRTAKRAEAYRCEAAAEAGAEADIVLDVRDEAWLEQYPGIDANEALYMYTCSGFYTKLLDFDGLMLHSSAVVVDGKAYLFSATSGTGKSTHTKLWLKQFGDRAYILNDDKPAVRLIDGVWHACGTPWSGKHDLSRPECVPLAGIAMVNRDVTNHIERYSGPMAVYELLSQTLRPKDKMAVLLELLDKLVSQVPVWKLYCNMDPEAALVSYKAMSGDEKE